MTEELNAEELRRRFHYDAETGVFTRLVPASRGLLVGTVAGTKHSKGYVVICILGKIYKAHRLAWLYVHGQWPAAEIDHINHKRSDNRIANLREADRTANTSHRSGPRRDNRLGVLGVTQIGNRFIARIVIRGESKYLGMHRTAEAAHNAYLTAKQGAST